MAPIDMKAATVTLPKFRIVEDIAVLVAATYCPACGWRRDMGAGTPYPPGQSGHATSTSKVEAVAQSALKPT